MKGALIFFVLNALLLGCISAKINSAPVATVADHQSVAVSNPSVTRSYQDSLSCKMLQNPVDHPYVYERISALSGFEVGPDALIRSSELKQKILRPFSSDGCSSSPDGIPLTEKSSVWMDCCVRHDAAYWMGGALEQKKKADEQLRSCITDKGYPNIAKIYQTFVMEFGGPSTTQSFRWGYGWNYKRNYAALSPEENQQIKNLYGVDEAQFVDFIMAKKFVLQKICDTFDPVFYGARKEEIAIYRFLNSRLKKSDVITWARVNFFNQKQLSYEIKLQSCDVPVVVTLYQDASRLAEIKSSCDL